MNIVAVMSQQVLKLKFLPGCFFSLCRFAQPDMSTVEVTDLTCLVMTLLVLTEQRMLFVVCFPLYLEEIFLTPLYHLDFDFGEL